MTHVDIRRESLAKTRDERFRMLVDQIVDHAIFILDATGEVATWNAGAERMNGYSASEIIGRHASTFYVPQDAGKCARTLDASVREGPVEDEGWRVRKDGSLFWANVVITALRDSQERVVGFGMVTRDLTERRKTEEALRQSEERLRLLAATVSDYATLMLDPRGQAVRAREDVLALVSHDLRNPLSTVLLAARIIQQRADQSDSGARTAKAAGNIVKAVGRMSRLLADLLDLAKLDAGKPLAIETETRDMGDLIREAVELFAAPVSTKMLNLTTEVSAPARAQCDSQRMLQVLSNLIDNAIKHTREGGAIQVGVTTTEGEVVLWVRDTGAGLSEEQIRHIFEPHWQADGERKGRVGLGLPIVKAIAAAHSGRVWVESAAGAGSTFHFALPKCDDAARG